MESVWIFFFPNLILNNHFGCSLATNDKMYVVLVMKSRSLNWRNLHCRETFQKFPKVGWCLDGASGDLV